MPKIEPTGSPPLDPENTEASLSDDQTKEILAEEPSEMQTEEAQESEPLEAESEAPGDVPETTDDELLKNNAVSEDTAKSDNKKPGLGTNIKAAIALWWANKKLRNITIGCFAVIVIALLAVPPSRYFIFNNLSVRASASMQVLDESTTLPLKNVQVELGGSSGLTDDNGKVTLRHVKLGRSQIVISKRAFAPKSRSYIVGWGSNPLDGVSLKPVGTQYIINVRDFLSDKPVAKAQAESAIDYTPMAGASSPDIESSNQANAQSDDKGKIVLTTEQTGDQPFTVTIMAKGYRDETLTINPDDKRDHFVKLVPGRKEVFVTKRSGKYDIYTVDVDGKNEKLLLAGTGTEQEGMVLVPHPTDEVAAYVSTRDNTRNSDGYVLSTLVLVDLNTGQTTKVAQSERVQIVDWVGDRLVYVQVAAGASAANPRRERLISYDYKENSSVELAATNYFNDILAATGNVYYASSSAYQPTGNVGLFRVNANGSNRTNILKSEVWNIFRTSYDDLSLSVGQNWYNHQIGATTASKANGAPAVLKTRVYIDNPDDKNSLWVDNRDGKGALLLYSQADKKDKTLRNQSGLQYPVRWLNATTVVYRIKTDQETADYVMSIQGGEPRKLGDVTNTAGVSAWYYY